MFLRRHQRNKNGEAYDYWTLVESVRTVRGARPRIVAAILTLARFCAPSSELQIADFGYGKTALDDLENAYRPDANRGLLSRHETRNGAAADLPPS
jgi:hypothetical protein